MQCRTQPLQRTHTSQLLCPPALSILSYLLFLSQGCKFCLSNVGLNVSLVKLCHRTKEKDKNHRVIVRNGIECFHILQPLAKEGV